MKEHEKNSGREDTADLQEMSGKMAKDDVKYIEYTEMLYFFSCSVFRMKQEDAFTSCKDVDGIGSLPYAIKKDVKQYLLKLNNVQIRSLDNTYP